MGSVFSGKKVLVTAGSTKAYIDAVRYISNTSSGRLGSVIASELLRRGARVTFFHGQGTLTPLTLAERGEVPLSQAALSRLEPVQIESVAHLAELMETRLKDEHFAAVVMAMAVLDYVPDPEAVVRGKMESGKERWTIELVPTPKIIDIVKKVSPPTLLVGFKLVAGLSREEMVAKARGVMEHSGADLVVANDLENVKEHSYKATLVERGNVEGEATLTDVDGRAETAILLCDRLEQRIA